MIDRVRLLRVIEYEGERAWVERTVKNSIHGERTFGGENIIRATTIGSGFPTIIFEPNKIDIASELSTETLQAIIDSRNEET